MPDMTSQAAPTRHVRFEIEADLPADVVDIDTLETLLASAVVQIAEPVLGYDVDGNEIRCDSEVRSALVVIVSKP